MASFEEKLNDGATALGILLNERQIYEIRRYYELLTEKNKVMNLTAVTGEDDFLLKHVIDSLSIIKCQAFAEMADAAVKAGTKAERKETDSRRLRLIDVGTGAGLPGMILKIAFPKLEVTLFDSLKKRLAFLDEVIGTLGLEGIRTVHGRAEDFGKDRGFREQYEIVVSRAVANMSSLSEYCLPFVRKGGFFAAYKSEDAAEEIMNADKAIRTLGGTKEAEELFKLPGSDITRRIVIIRKIKPTPTAYPRKAGTPSKNPL